MSIGHLAGHLRKQEWIDPESISGFRVGRVPHLGREGADPRPSPGAGYVARLATRGKRFLDDVPTALYGEFGYPRQEWAQAGSNLSRSLARRFGVPLSVAQCRHPAGFTGATMQTMRSVQVCADAEVLVITETGRAS